MSAIRYTYREAVIDGHLVDHDAPHVFITKLALEGIHYKIRAGLARIACEVSGAILLPAAGTRRNDSGVLSCS